MLIKKKPLIFLLLISFFLALIFTLSSPSTFESQKECFTSAHSYNANYNNLSNISKISPEAHNSIEAFSWSQIVIQIFSKFSNNICYSTLFLRFNIHFFPLIGASIICWRNFYNKSIKIFLLHNIPILILFRLFFYIPFPPINFNYPFLLMEVNTTTHINGALTCSFALFLYPVLLLINDKNIRLISLILGGLINPIISSLCSFSRIFELKKYLLTKDKKKLVIFESLIPVITFLSSKLIWNRLHNLEYEVNQSINMNESDISQEYFKFLDLIEFHRNRFSDLFFDIFLKFKSFLPSDISLEFANDDGLRIFVSYMGYLILTIFMIIIFNKKNYESNFLKITNPLLISLLIMLSIDFIVKLVLNPLKLNPLNLLLIYNHFYISRVITIGFTILYFIFVISITSFFIKRFFAILRLKNI